MNNLVYLIMTAKDNSELNEIVNANLEFLNENPRLFTLVKDTRKRIARVRKEKNVSWKIYELN
jgi:hypothetical protein